MTKYVMTIEVDAEQFLPEEDKIPKGVTSDGPRSPKNDPRAKWVLMNQDGMKYLSPGDYVVTTPAGDKYVVQKDRFEADYKILGNSK